MVEHELSDVLRERALWLLLGGVKGLDPDREVSHLCVERGTLLVQPIEYVSNRLGTVEQGSMGLPSDPTGEEGRAGVEEDDGEVASAHACAVVRAQHESAAARDHARLVMLEQLLERVGLQVAEGPLAVVLEDVSDGAISDLLQRSVSIHEVPIETRREPPTDGGLAGAHQAHEDDMASHRASVERGDEGVAVAS